MPQRKHFHYVDQERTPSLEPMPLPEEREYEQFANLDRTGATPPTEETNASNHYSEPTAFQQPSVTPPRPGSAIKSPQPEPIISPYLGSATSPGRDSVAPPELRSVASPQLESVTYPQFGPVTPRRRPENHLPSSSFNLTSLCGMSFYC